MAIHKLIDEFYEHSYTLIAIHSSLEDYRLAYHLNETLKIKLKRTKDNTQDVNKMEMSVYEWHDLMNETSWCLLSNGGYRRVQSENHGLFGENESTFREYLIPEYKKADFFLKIDDGQEFKNEDLIISKIRGLHHIITAYSVDPNQLKSKNNLIFLSNA